MSTARLTRWLAVQFPSECTGCRLNTPDGPICRRCRADWPLAPARAIPPLCWLAAPYSYEGQLADLVSRMKSANDPSLAGALGRLLAEQIPQPEGDWILAPIPLHRRRLLARGFNQALAIARPLARSWRLRLRLALAKATDTPAQRGLDAAARRRNLGRPFSAPPWVRGAAILLVDDVVTTGTTLATAARTLKSAGASRVAAIAVAQSIQRRE